MPRVKSESSGTRRSDLARSKARKSETDFRQRRLLLISGAIGALLLFIALPVWLVTSGYLDQQKIRLVNASGRAGLALEELYVQGRVHTPPADIEAAINLHPKDPLILFDPLVAQTRLIALPWVKHAAVERRFPNTIMVTLEERQPFALWQREGKHVLIDAEGAILTQDKIHRFAALPVVIGAGAPVQAARLLAELENFPELRTMMQAATLVGDRRWNLTLKSGIEVRLPENNISSALTRLTNAQSEGRILEKDVVMIDLRQQDRMVVRTSKEAAAKRERPEEKL